MEGLLKAGAAGFTDRRYPLMDGECLAKEAMEEAARLDTVLKPLSNRTALTMVECLNSWEFTDAGAGRDSLVAETV